MFSTGGVPTCTVEVPAGWVGFQLAGGLQDPGVWLRGSHPPGWVQEMWWFPPAPPGGNDGSF